MRSFAVTALAVALLMSPACGQLLDVDITPNPAPVGSNITVTAWDAYGLGLFSPGGSMLSDIRQGSPNGPSVVAFAGILLPQPIPSCAGGGSPRTQQWNQQDNFGQQVAPGDYWMAITHELGMFGPQSTEWFCVTIPSASTSPALSAVNTPTVGTTFQMAINAPLHPMDTYILAMSGTTNFGFPLGAKHFCLDMDAVFNLTFPSPTPALFQNFQGNLDLSGSTSAIAFLIPNVPFLSCVPVHAQALILPVPGAGTPIECTNGLHFWMQ